jgi:hypothetical protein
MISNVRFSRRHVDLLNSLAWFSMDLLWLSQLRWPAYLATGIAVTTGAALPILGRGRARSRMLEDLALNAWIWMNALWLVSDLGERPVLRTAAVTVGCLGAVFLLGSVRRSRRSSRTLRHFNKMRLPGR